MSFYESMCRKMQTDHCTNQTLTNVTNRTGAVQILCRCVLHLRFLQITQSECVIFNPAQSRCAQGQRVTPVGVHVTMVGAVLLVRTSENW